MSAKVTHIFFSKNSSIYAIFNDQSFNDMLTNDIVSFEQLGPEVYPEINILFFHTGFPQITPVLANPISHTFTRPVGNREFLHV